MRSSSNTISSGRSLTPVRSLQNGHTYPGGAWLTIGYEDAGRFSPETNGAWITKCA